MGHTLGCILFVLSHFSALLFMAKENVQGGLMLDDYMVLIRTGVQIKLSKLQIMQPCFSKKYEGFELR